KKKIKIRRRAGRLSTKISNPAVCRLLILVNSHPAFYFLFEISYLLRENILMRGKLSDLKRPISTLVVA
ncbi:hypothetical protein LI205_32625, partial [bacterium MSK18_59]|nr:hypothetical protein [bacterium MSK18_59]